MKKIILIFAAFFLTMSSSFAWWHNDQRDIYSYDGIEEYDYHDININAYCDVFWIHGFFTPHTHYLGSFPHNLGELVVMDDWTSIFQYNYSSLSGPTVVGFSQSWMYHTWGTVRVYTTLTNGRMLYNLEWGTFGS